MRNIKYFCTMALLGILLTMQITACGSKGDDAGPAPTPGTPFVTSDLAGTWYLYATNGAGAGVPPAGSITAGNLRGKLILDSLGQVVLGGTYTRSNNQSASITGGLFGIDSAGVLSGSATTNLGINFYLGSGMMDSSKNILSFVATTNYGEYDLFTAVRTMGGFSSLDLAGTWHLYGANGDYGQIVVTDAGNGTRATIAAPGGGGYITIDGNGVLNDTLSGTSYFVTGSTPPNLYLNQGKISYGKDVMFFVAGTDPSNYDVVAAVRGGGTFAAADLAGTWRVYGIASSTTDKTKKATLSGMVTFDASGKATAGSYTRTDEFGAASFTIASGTVTIDNAGVLSGNFGNVNFVSGKMNAAKKMMSLTGNTSATEQDFLFCIKGN